MSFFIKKIDAENNIGKELEFGRYKTGLSLKLISKHINIDAKYLEALEKNNWSKLPGEVYAKNFFKKYCEFLKVNPEKFKKNISTLLPLKQDFSSQNFHKKTFFKDLINFPKIIKMTIIIVIAALVLCYIVLQIIKITRAPEITLYYPKSDLVVNNNYLIINGFVNKEADVKINQENIILGPKNNFEQKIILTPGLNNIVIEAKTKYSKPNIIERKIIYEP